MADMQDDSEDSRTLLAGRKRGFEEASLDQDTQDLVDGDGPHKRAWEDSSYEPADTSRFEGAHDLALSSGQLENAEAEQIAPFTNTTSTPTTVLQPEVETIHSSSNAPFQANIESTAMEQQKVNLAETIPLDSLRDDVMDTETTSMPQGEAQVGAISLPHTTSWNTGIQKGLRTSFASKKTRLNSMSAPLESESGSLRTDVASDQHVEIDMGEDGLSFRGQSPSFSDNGDSTNLPSSLDTEEQESNPTSDPRQKRRRKKKSKTIGYEPTVAVQPVPFKKLKAKQILALSPEAKSVYKQAKRLHDANDPEKQRRKAERDELDRQRRVAKEQAAASAVIAANLAKPKRDTHTIRAEVEANTVAAAKLLADFGWPLPKAHKTTAETIYWGFTFYPRKYDRSSTYSKGNVEFVMTPTLDSQGLPIQFPDVSFNEFAVKFLIVYSKNWPTLAGDSLVKAFGIYINFFYANHYGDDSSWRQKIKDLTSPDKGAFTLEQAISEATRRISLSSAHPTKSKPLNPQPKAKTESGDLGERDVIMMEDDEASESGEVSRPSTSSDGEIINVDLNDEQLYLQQKYFPSANATTTATRNCLACSRVGHGCADCPTLLCTSCGEKHSTFRCPERIRCQKCRERGHTKEACPEKLGVPKSELQCEFCSSREHLETECHWIWRSFDPRLEDIQTVRDIPIDCYSCGMSNHFGPDCGLNNGRLLTGGLTWSRFNLEKYVDPASDRRALSAGIDYSIPARKGFNIKGKANDPITFDDSSDDGRGFIRPKVQTAERGHIRFNERQESRPVHGLPRRLASPVAPYRSGYDSGFGNGEEPRYGMSSDRYYPDTPHSGAVAFHPRPPKEGDSGGNNQKPPKRGDNNASRGRISKNGGAKGGRSRGRGH